VRPAPAVLICNVHSLRNAGDAALLAQSVAGLRAVFDRPQLAVSSNYPAEAGAGDLGVTPLPSPGALVGAFAGRTPPVQAAALLRRGLSGDWGELCALVRRADLVLSCPGNPFFSTGRFGWPLLLALIPPWLALRQGKPFYLLPQTLGPFRRPWEAAGVRAVCRRARRVYVRDALSLRLAQRWGVERARYVPDLAFALPAAQDEAACAVLRRWGWQPGRPALGVSVIPAMSRALPAAALERSYPALAQALGELAQRERLQLVFFAQVSGPAACEDDRRPARRVLAGLPPGVPAVLVDEALPAALLKACYARMDALLAGRLHAGIFAAGAGTPALWIGYLSKTRGVLAALGLEDWLVPLEAATVERLRPALAALWTQRAALRQDWLARLPALAAQTRLPFADLAADWNGR